jgi:cell division GTPase FtsZ
MKEYETVCRTIGANINDQANRVIGIFPDESLGITFQVMVIFTGFYRWSDKVVDLPRILNSSNNVSETPVTAAYTRSRSFSNDLYDDDNDDDIA